jgi:hypothetical protein
MCRNPLVGVDHRHSAIDEVRPVPPALCVERQQTRPEDSFDRPVFLPIKDIECLLLGARILRQIPAL